MAGVVELQYTQRLLRTLLILSSMAAELTKGTTMPPAGLQVTLGEAMVVLYPDGHRPLAQAVEYGSDVGGAEYNVATTLARLGLPTAWISRLGDDGLGERIRSVAEQSGVDTSGVETDDRRHTGLYLKETLPGTAGPTTRMHYYRSDSAAAALSPETLSAPAVRGLLQNAQNVHTSGITAALSASAAEALAGLRAAVGQGTTISVDLNYRPQLWRDRDPAPLTALIDQADTLFAGRDEAELHFGHADPARLFEAHPQLSLLVIKDDARRASTYRRDGGETHVPCLTVEVVETVGAGDAFAAGFLCAWAEGRADAAALRLGHVAAALTLLAHGDRPVAVVDAEERERIAAAPDEEWDGWRVHPGALPWRVRP